MGMLVYVVGENQPIERDQAKNGIARVANTDAKRAALAIPRMAPVPLSTRPKSYISNNTDLLVLKRPNAGELLN